MWAARPRWSHNENSNYTFPSPPLHASGGKLLYDIIMALLLDRGDASDVVLTIHASEFQGTPAGARHISLPVIFLPIFLLQGAGVLFATLRFVEKTVLLLRSGAAVGQYHVISSRVRDCFAFMHHGSR